MSVAQREFDVALRPIGQAAFAVRPATTHERVMFSCSAFPGTQDRSVYVVLPNAKEYEMTGRRLLPGNRDSIDLINGAYLVAASILETSPRFMDFPQEIGLSLRDVLGIRSALDVAETLRVDMQPRTDLLLALTNRYARIAQNRVRSIEDGVLFTRGLLASDNSDLVHLGTMVMEPWWNHQLQPDLLAALQNPLLHENVKPFIHRLIP